MRQIFNILQQVRLVFCEKYYSATNRQCFQLKYSIKIRNFQDLCVMSEPLFPVKFAQGQPENQHPLPASPTSQQHLISISFQPPPPGSSTKSASSFHHQTEAPNQHQLPTTRQQHQMSISFQFLLPGSSTTSAGLQQRHPANQLLTLLPCHTHIMAARSVVV